MGDSHVGLQARLMSQALRKLNGTLNRTDTICLFTNQLREKIGVMFGSPETTSGGRALRFYASVRLDIRRIETLKEGVEAIGNRVRVKVVKNKVAPPFKQAEFDIIYGDGISWEGTVLEVGLERKIVQKSGSYFSFGDERLGQGRQNATAFLQEHPDVVQAILQRDPGAGRRRAGDLGAAPAAGRGADRGRRRCSTKKTATADAKKPRRRPRSRSGRCRPSTRSDRDRRAGAAASRPLAPRARRAACASGDRRGPTGRRARDPRARRLRRRRAVRRRPGGGAGGPRLRRRVHPARPGRARRRGRGGRRGDRQRSSRSRSGRRPSSSGSDARPKTAAQLARKGFGAGRARGRPGTGRCGLSGREL